MRLRNLALTLAILLTLLPGVAKAAGPMGAASGQVVALGGGYIELRVGRAIVNYVIPLPFYAVYLADKTHAALENIALGMVVRVAYTTTARGQLVAREIDILST